MENLRLPERIKSILRDFRNRLQEIYREDLISVILYGSASSGEFTEKRSNVNVVIVLNDTGLVNLSRSYEVVNARRFGMVKAVFFTEQFIKCSLDIFPIEFLDIAENYTILYGRDIVKEFNIDSGNLRFQCEHELKSKLTNIKKYYLTTRRKRDLEGLLFTTFTSTLHILRNLLRLKGIRPPYLKEEILSESEKALGIDTTLLYKILWAKTKNMKLTQKDVDTLLIGFVKELEAVSSIVDSL